MDKPARPKTRLFSAEPLVAGGQLCLRGEQAKYIARVLRLKTQSELIVFDGSGGDYTAIIESVESDRVLLRVARHRGTKTESPLIIHLVQGISRGGRMDLVIQKSTELGVSHVTPVISEHSVVKLEGDRAAKRRDHWVKVARSACEQCGRNTVPDIDLPLKLDRWLVARRAEHGARIMLDPTSRTRVSSVPAPTGIVELLVGPEGGLSQDECARCLEAGFTPVALGPRTLRTETAALAAIAIIQARWGDM